MATEQINQELKEAALESVGEIEDMAGMAGYNGFIKGATWQKEQSANNAIEFGDFLKSECKKICPDSDCIGPDPTYWQWKTVNDRYTTKELYELWQQSKKK